MGFQFTRLYKARLSRAAFRQYLAAFQFTRLYKARQKEDLAKLYDLPISIHAPIQGATTVIPPNQDPFPISIHAPIQGATRPIQIRYRQRPNFNSRAYTRRDRSGKILFACFAHFNSRAYTRRDRRVFSARNLCCEFQFTHLYKARPKLKITC